MTRRDELIEQVRLESELLASRHSRGHYRDTVELDQAMSQIMLLIDEARQTIDEAWEQARAASAAGSRRVGLKKAPKVLTLDDIL